MVTLQVRRTSEFERIVRGSGGNVIWDDAEVIPRWLHEILPDAVNHAFFDRGGIDFTIDMTTGRSPGITITDADWLA
ncbi:MAG: hypothetical protein KDA86_04405 [Planctomycetaceae bacterium]|nr:hypothetical protein [Planctomycetaceae bacterium]